MDHPIVRDRASPEVTGPALFAATMPRSSTRPARGTRHETGWRPRTLPGGAPMALDRPLAPLRLTVLTGAVLIRRGGESRTGPCPSRRLRPREEPTDAQGADGCRGAALRAGRVP